MPLGIGTSVVGVFAVQFPARATTEYLSPLEIPEGLGNGGTPFHNSFGWFRSWRHVKAHGSQKKALICLRLAAKRGPWPFGFWRRGSLKPMVRLGFCSFAVIVYGGHETGRVKSCGYMAWTLAVHGKIIKAKPDFRKVLDREHH